MSGSLQSVSSNSPDHVFERHFSPDELAEIWNMSADTIRRMFDDEPGVLVVEHTKTKSRRRYRTLRIPESVAVRVHRRRSNPNSLELRTR